MAVFLILILLTSNRYNFSDLFATALKFPSVTNLSRYFQIMSMMFSITAIGKRHSSDTALCIGFKKSTL
jgi:hypothetical protein